MTMHGALTIAICGALAVGCASVDTAAPSDAYNSPVLRVGSHIPVARERAAQQPAMTERDLRILEDELARQRGYKPPGGS